MHYVFYLEYDAHNNDVTYLHILKYNNVSSQFCDFKSVIVSSNSCAHVYFKVKAIQLSADLCILSSYV